MIRRVPSTTGADLARRLQLAAGFVDEFQLGLDHAHLHCRCIAANPSVTGKANSRRVMMAADLYADYVIVGAGSAGCVLAARLTESGKHKVRAARSRRRRPAAPRARASSCPT